MGVVDKFERDLETRSPGWGGDPVIDEEEVLGRKELLKRAKAGCEEAIAALKAPPYGLSALVLDGKKII